MDMWFIDLPYAYDSVDKEVLWEVLARFDVLVKGLEVFRQAYEVMRALVRTDGEEHSKWVNVTQGLRQGCVLSPFWCWISYLGPWHSR